jgi:hypothetical protein
VLPLPHAWRDLPVVESRTCARDPDAVLGIVDHLRRRLARFKVCAHFLEAGGKCLNLFLLFGYRRLLFCIIQ